MIHDALRLILNQLNRKLPSSGDGYSVVLGNIASADAGGESNGGAAATDLSRVVLSLVNVSEDHALKNGPRHRHEGGRVVYENRPVNLHLFLLFSANNTVYATAIKQLARVIEFFQGQNIFTVRNSPDLTEISASPEELAGIRIIMELQSLTFEQVNHLWGSLGGKQVPFVLYRARLVSLTASEIEGTGAPINDIAINTSTTTWAPQ
ncbi:MAG: DUF4255 domain-containing protein [Opitutales bacterium]